MRARAGSNAAAASRLPNCHAAEAIAKKWVRVFVLDQDVSHGAEESGGARLLCGFVGKSAS